MAGVLDISNYYIYNMHVTEITEVISCNAHGGRLVGVFYGVGNADGH